MVSDIEDNLEAAAEHDLIAAIAGDGDALGALRAEHTHKVDPALPDTTPPADEYLVLDADSSQNRAINAALAGESFVLQGPPGTGKSQTIANLVAAMMARGRSVLFVAEKRAAIEAVTKRLTNVGLDGFVMDLHGGTVKRRELARRLASRWRRSAPHRRRRGGLHERSRTPGPSCPVRRVHCTARAKPWGPVVLRVQQRLGASQRPGRSGRRCREGGEPDRCAVRRRPVPGDVVAGSTARSVGGTPRPRRLGDLSERSWRAGRRGGAPGATAGEVSGRRNCSARSPRRPATPSGGVRGSPASWVWPNRRRWWRGAT